MQRGSLWFSNRTDRTVRPVQTLEFEISAFAEARLSGTLLDEHGSSVSWAYWSFEFTSELLKGERPDHWSHAACDASGRFDLDGLPPGTLEMRVTRDGLSPLCWNSGPLAEGQTRTGIELVLTTGMCIAGRVTTADGKPASQCKVHLVAERPRGGKETCLVDYPDDRVTSSDGSFEFCGLDRGPWTVEARRQLRSGAGSVRAQGVAGGTRDLILALDETSRLEGVVVDDSGAPVTKFRLRALPCRDSEGSEGTDGSWWEARPTEFDTKDGSFVLGGLHPGRWVLGIEASGFGSQVSARYSVPGAGPCTIVLPRLTTVSGRVVDPDGRAIRAQIISDRKSSEELEPTERSDTPAATGDDGSFCLKNVPPGVREIHAEAPDCANSRTVVLDVAPGQQVDGVVLTLRRGGAIAGRVLDEKGRPATGWKVAGISSRTHTTVESTVDGIGEFSLRPLVPGSYSLFASPPMERKPNGWPGDSGRAWKTSVRVQDGETCRVVLGDLPAVQAHIEGRVTRAGAPVGGIEVTSFRPAALAFLRASTDASGQFRMDVASTGRWTVMVRPANQNAAQISREVTVVAGQTLHADFEIANGMVSGRVLDPDGAPVGDAQVNLTIRGIGRGSPVAAGGNTAPDGTYSIEGIPAGEYELEAYARMQSNGRRPWPELRQRLSLSEGQRLEGLELRFRRGGRVLATITGPHGLPVAEARPGVFDETSRELGVATSPFVGNVHSDGPGQLELTEVPVGRLLMFASTDALVCAPVVIEVREDATTEVRLELAPGTIAVLRDSNAEDPARTWIQDFELWDSNGLDWGRLGFGLHAWGPEDDDAGPGMRLGPLPRGKYRLVCRSESGEALTNELVLEAVGPQAFEAKLTR